MLRIGRFPQPIEVERKPRRDTNAQHPFRSPIRQAVSPPRKPIERNKSPKPVRDDLGTGKREGDRKSRKEDVERLNQEIRRMNSLDNLRVNKSLTKKKKNLRDYMVSPKKEGQLKRQKSPPKEQADRRNELGIGFLNELEMNKIKKLIQNCEL